MLQIHVRYDKFRPCFFITSVLHIAVAILSLVPLCTLSYEHVDFYSSSLLHVPLLSIIGLDLVSNDLFSLSDAIGQITEILSCHAEIDRISHVMSNNSESLCRSTGGGGA
jgi:hypothetical protein